jgi:hypothetical protein
VSLCASCEDCGIVPFVPVDCPKPDADIVADDLHFAICLCDKGRDLRWDRNGKARTVPLWRVWCAREQIEPSRVALVEQVFTTGELEAAGLVAGAVPKVDRRAALLAQGTRR